MPWCHLSFAAPTMTHLSLKTTGVKFPLLRNKMLKISQFYHLLPITLIIAASQPALPNENYEDALVPEEVVTKQISDIDYKPPTARLLRSNFVLSSGIDMDTPTIQEYEVLMPNIWGIRSVSKVKNGASQGVSISICGIIELVGNASSEINFETTVSVPINKMFTSFGIRVNVNGTLSGKAKNLILGEGSKKICTPTPGDIFSYELRTDSVSKNSSPFVSNRTHSNTFRMRCTVGEAKPMTEIVAGQSGTYLPVACSGTNLTTNMQTTANYAFVQAAGLYINLNREINTFRSTVALSSLIYE